MQVQVIAALVLAASLVGCACEKNCPRSVRIKAIGGCDKHGACGVEYDDGTFGDYVYHPVVGQPRTAYGACPK